MKKRMLLGIILITTIVFSSCGKRDWRIAEVEKYSKDDRTAINMVKFEPNIQYFENNLDLFFEGSKTSSEYSKYIDANLNFQQLLYSNEFSKEYSQVTFFKDRLTADSFKNTEVGKEKYITEFTSFLKDDELVRVLIFSKEEPEFKEKDVVEFTVLPYMAYEVKEENIRTLLLVATDYKVVN